MTTRLRSNVAREVRSPDGREMIVILAPSGVLIREKGKRTTYGPISYGAVFSLGAKQEAEAQRRERKPRVRRSVI
jgi:hypothetical protein